MIHISMRSPRNNWEFKFISLYFSFIQLFSSVYKVEHGYGHISFQQEINRLILPPGGLRARHPTVELLIEYLGGIADLWIGFNHTMKILQAREGLITQRNCLLFGAFSQGLNHSLTHSIWEASKMWNNAKWWLRFLLWPRSKMMIRFVSTYRKWLLSNSYLQFL